MKRGELDDLIVFKTVAEERSFTRAAARLGVSQSALSHGIKALEERIGLRLLARTTRSVSTTEAGERLLQRLQPALGDIDRALEDLHDLRGRPSGALRINTPRHAAETILRPALIPFLRAYPEVTVEIAIDEALVDIVAARYDAGIRFGYQIARDMIAVRIGPDLRAALVASLDYFAKRPKPRTPGDLVSHHCINYRFQTGGGLYAWELDDGKAPVVIRVNGPLVVNDSDLMLGAALDGHGIAYLFEDVVNEHIAEGRLVRVLSKWCRPFPGYHLYYPGRRQSPALAAFVETIRYRPSGRRGSAPAR